MSFDESFPLRDWRSLWLGLDPASLRVNIAPGTGSASLVLGLLMTAAASTAQGSVLLSVCPAAIWSGFVIWAAFMLVALVFQERAFNREGTLFSVLRVGLLVSSVTYGASFGAASQLDASPAYVMMFTMGIPAGVFMMGRARRALFLMASVPVVLRFTFVDHPVWTSLLIALTCGVGLAGLIKYVSNETDKRYAFEDGTRELATRNEEQRESFARLSVLTSVHDGLSGLLLVAQTKAAVAESVDELLPLTGQIVLRGAELVGARRHSDLARLERDLTRIAAAVGAPLELQAVGEAAALPNDDLQQLAELATEATLNALRAAPSEPLKLVVSATDSEVRFEARSVGGISAPAGTGRGLRYARLRAQMRGGDAFVEKGRTFTLVV